MMAKTASIVNGGRHKHKIRFITYKWTMLHLGFSLNELLLCYLAMVVGNNKSTTMKNIGKFLAILIAMQMRWYDVGHIAW